MHIRRFFLFSQIPSKPRIAILTYIMVFLIILVSEAYSQNENLLRGIVILGQPAESTIRLKGAYTFIGKTPFTISQNLSGPYMLSASKRGYESKQMELNFAGDPFRKITINLRPLSRFKATYRSAFVPGWGQRYKGAKGRGLFFTGLALGAGVGTLVTHLSYRSDVDDAEQAQRDYESVKNNFEQAQVAWNKWQAAHLRAEDSYDRYRRSLIITAAVWTLNVLDAILMPPGPGRPQKGEVTLSSRLGFDNSQIGLRFSF